MTYGLLFPRLLFPRTFLRDVFFPKAKEHLFYRGLLFLGLLFSGGFFFSGLLVKHFCSKKEFWAPAKVREQKPAGKKVWNQKSWRQNSSCGQKPWELKFGEQKSYRKKGSFWLGQKIKVKEQSSRSNFWTGSFTVFNLYKIWKRMKD